ncbi:MAG: TRAFs-binding domain-containing protein [Microcoleaceae cyanobacterium MO_207.B10]|nr:TRAFs-binding domain-containing protein [Microcoleaceae cyanobacterium MO_207.B10]
MNYKPEPIDTSHVTLTTEHLKITELLAKNTHEIWSTQRMSEGWKYGKNRDDAQKLHPGLVPYEELPESEKDYDRVISVGVIKTLLALGYQIEGSQEAPAKTSVVDDSNLSLILESLKNSSELNLKSLQEIRRETINLELRSPDIFRILGEYILKLGEPLMAYDVLSEGLKEWPNHIRLQQLLALALARGGATQRANNLLLELVNSGKNDQETISLLARTHKDLWQQASSPEESTQQIALAAQRYQQAYQMSGDYYPGINAATMTMLMGDDEQARAIAAEVQEKCLAKLPPVSQRSEYDYWILATLGEAALILEENSEAEKWYNLAVELARGKFGDISSTRRNASLIIEYRQGDMALMKRCFQIPKVVVFSGHMIDDPGRTTPRFPPEIESQVYEAIRDRLIKLDARLGYASAACGSDILFLEVLYELQGEAHIVLPHAREHFIKESVDIIPGGSWRKRFDQVLAKATEVVIPTHYDLQQSNIVYEYTNSILYGMARMRAEQLDTELIPMAVWNQQPGGVGGTVKAIKYWQKCNHYVEVIDLEEILQAVTVNRMSNRISLPATTSPIGLQQELVEDKDRLIMALLFADVKGYSKLKEKQISIFVEHFLGAVGKFEAESAFKPVMKNTWGDALYYVFPSVRDAGVFALELCDLVQNTDWEKVGLPPGLNLRVALHAGLVYQFINPITGMKNYSGTHVSYAARIEPITPPGKVYSSQAFAAMSASEGVKEFSCDYVGQTPLAKSYGTFPTYHVRKCGCALPKK